MTEIARHARSASESLCEDLAHLSETLAVLPAASRRAARWRVSASRWNLVEAPDVAFDLAKMAADWFEDAGFRPWPTDTSMSGCLSQDLLAMRDAGQLSRFALESGVRSLHSAGDLLAQLVRTSLRLCDNERCSLAQMLGSRRTCMCAMDEPEGLRLSRVLHGFRDSPQFGYVEAVSNRLKHRNLVPHGIRAARDRGSGGVVVVSQGLSGFSHDGRRVRTASLSDLVKKAERLRELAAPVVCEVTRIVDEATARGQEAAG